MGWRNVRLMQSASQAGAASQVANNMSTPIRSRWTSNKPGPVFSEMAAESPRTHPWTANKANAEAAIAGDALQSQDHTERLDSSIGELKFIRRVQSGLTSRIRRRRAGSVHDTTDAIRAVACIRFVALGLRLIRFMDFHLRCGVWIFRQRIPPRAHALDDRIPRGRHVGEQMRQKWLASHCIRVRQAGIRYGRAGHTRE